MEDRIEMVRAGQEEFGLNRCCAAVGIHKSSWYWANTERERDRSDQVWKDRILEVIKDHPGYGRERITDELNERHDETINEKKVRRLLDDHELALKRNVTAHRPSMIQKTLRQHRGKVNLVEESGFDALEVFSTDFTELKYQGGSKKAYLMAFVDIVSKWCAGWAVGASQNTDLALAAWDNASGNVMERRGTLAGVIVHHDMDSVYTSYDWIRTLLLMDGVRISYSERGARDNPWIESFWGRLKVENRSLIHEAQDLAELTEIVDDRLKYYNQDRRHTALGNRTPMTALEEFLTRGD